jgi:NTP pyrophosphatase (non-canonical NTP hydrolase)
MVIAPAGHARRGADRTDAQREAAGKNLLFQSGAREAAAASLATEVGELLEAKTARNGYMSKATKSKVKTLVDTLVFLSQLPEASRQNMNKRLGYKQQRCYLTFVTLTLPAGQHLNENGEFDDEHAKRHLLRPFLEQLKYTFDVDLYIWVSEPQENGNIHFHLLIDKYIDNTKKDDNEAESQRLTKAWNSILARHGYIQEYATAQRARHAAGFAYDNSQQRRVEHFDAATGKYQTRMETVSYADQVEAYAYGEATNWENPNTVDIHKLKAQNNIKGYICKYLTKNDGEDGRRKLGGNLWGAADQLRDVQAYREEFGDELRDALIRLDASKPGALKTMLVTPMGNFTAQEFEDNDLGGQVPVLATIYTYSQAMFWKFAPWAFRRRFENYYREAFRQIYTPHLVAKPPGFEHDKRSQFAPVAVLA